MYFSACFFQANLRQQHRVALDISVTGIYVSDGRFREEAEPARPARASSGGEHNCALRGFEVLTVCLCQLIWVRMVLTWVVCVVYMQVVPRSESAFSNDAYRSQVNEGSSGSHPGSSRDPYPSRVQRPCRVCFPLNPDGRANDH